MPNSDFVTLRDLPKDTKDVKKVIYIHIPVIISDVVKGNALTPYVNYYTEQLYLAYKLPQLSKVARSPFDTLTSIMKWLALLGISITSAKVIWKYLKGESTQNTEVNIRLSEDVHMVLNNPREIRVEQILYRIIAVNFVTTDDLTNVVHNKGLFKRITNWLKQQFKRVISVVSKEKFYCYSTSEVDEETVKQLVKQPNTNIILVDMVNDLVTAYCNFENRAITVNTISLSELRRQKKSAGGVENIDKVVKLLKSIKVRSFR